MSERNNQNGRAITYLMAAQIVPIPLFVAVADAVEGAADATVGSEATFDRGGVKWSLIFSDRVYTLQRPTGPQHATSNSPRTAQAAQVHRGQVQGAPQGLLGGRIS